MFLIIRRIGKKRIFGAIVFFLLTAGLLVTVFNTKTRTTSPPSTEQPDKTREDIDFRLQPKKTFERGVTVIYDKCKIGFR